MENKIKMIANYILLESYTLAKLSDEDANRLIGINSKLNELLEKKQG